MQKSNNNALSFIRSNLGHIIIIIVVFAIMILAIMGIIHHHNKVNAPTQSDKAKTEKVESKKTVKRPKGKMNEFQRTRYSHDKDQNSEVNKLNKVYSKSK